MGQEKRKRTRAPVHFDLVVSLAGEAIRVTLINVSMTGILCTSSPLFRKDAACRVVISLTEDLQITIDSKILRMDEHETAISFTAMDEESYAHLKRLVQYNTGDADLIDQELHEKAFPSTENR